VLWYAGASPRRGGSCYGPSQRLASKPADLLHEHRTSDDEDEDKDSGSDKQL
jgi:hypothetical protein